MTDRAQQTPPPPARRSAWTTRQKIVRVVWTTIGRALWRLLPGARPALIRLFGGSAGKGCSLATHVAIAIPWNIHLGERVTVADHAILYSLGPISIGDDSVIDPFAHLCAGSHDHTDPAFPLTTPPISLGARCFVGADAYIGPGVALGDGCRVLARASVHSSRPEGTTLAGNPAKPVTDSTPEPSP